MTRNGGPTDSAHTLRKSVHPVPMHDDHEFGTLQVEDVVRCGTRGDWMCRVALAVSAVLTLSVSGGFANVIHAQVRR